MNSLQTLRLCACRLSIVISMVVAASFTSPALANNGGGGGGGGAGGGGNTNFNFGQPVAGIDVDAGGVLKVRQFDPRVARQRLAAARQQNNNELMRSSKLRMVSLNRLEAELSTRLEAGGTASNDMLAMAGLTSVQYVFFYPETKDIVVAGPAEGFIADPTNRFVGIESGRPTVLLEDMVTALRAYAPGAPPTQIISVSIDPTPEGLQRLQRYIASVRIGPNSNARALADKLKNNLGLQTVSIQGIPNSTHFARVLVEADYRMKLVGIGLEKLPVRLMSYVDRANSRTVAANALERWYFQPNYDGIAVSEDGLAMKINERGVQLVGANERVAGGRRTASGRVNLASQAFCKDFSERFNLIAERVRIYAELRQLIDVAIAAAYIQEQDFYNQADWSLGALGQESQFAVERYQAPEQVETAVNAIWRGKQLMTPLGGGVQMQPRLALRTDTVTVDRAGESVQVKQQAGPSSLAEGQWWWD